MMLALPNLPCVVIPETPIPVTPSQHEHVMELAIESDSYGIPVYDTVRLSTLFKLSYTLNAFRVHFYKFEYQ